MLRKRTDYVKDLAKGLPLRTRTSQKGQVK